MTKCKFAKKCKLYKKDDRICNKDGGMYYDEGYDRRPAGCYREMENDIQKQS